MTFYSNSPAIMAMQLMPCCLQINIKQWFLITTTLLTCLYFDTLFCARCPGHQRTPWTPLIVCLCPSTTLFFNFVLGQSRRWGQFWEIQHGKFFIRKTRNSIFFGDPETHRGFQQHGCYIQRSKYRNIRRTQRNFSAKFPDGQNSGRPRFRSKEDTRKS